MFVSKRMLGLLAILLLMNSVGHAQPHRYSNLFRAPLGLDTYFDYSEALTAARRVGKPLLIEFTGHATINAIKIEQHIWPDSAVFPLLRTKYVILQVYVDDRTPLPKARRGPAGLAHQKPRTLGSEWADWQQVRFDTNYQPYYVVLNPITEQRLIPSLPIESLSDPVALAQWLQAGSAALSKLR